MNLKQKLTNFKSSPIPLGKQPSGIDPNGRYSKFKRDIENRTNLKDVKVDSAKVKM